jgi:hypothetical protein
MKILCFLVHENASASKIVCSSSLSRKKEVGMIKNKDIRRCFVFVLRKVKNLECSCMQQEEEERTWKRDEKSFKSFLAH